MLKIFMLGLCALVSINAFSAPAEMSLAAPTKIKRVKKQLKLEFMLPCASEYTLDTAKIVMTNDDSGDMAAAIGLVYSQSDRECKKTNTLKKFEITVNPKSYGYEFVEGASFEAMDIAK